MEIKEIGLDLIKPYWRNPRINDETINALSESIEKFGFNVPIVLDQENTIITGHARFRALKKLNKTVAPCVISDMSKEKANEYRISDNKIQELSKWDNETLKLELRELESAIGFKPEEFDKLIETDIQYINSTEDDLRKEIFKQDNQFKDNYDNYKDDKLQVICPKCKEEFFLSRKELNSKYDEHGYSKDQPL